eukprot:Nk52_evm4s1073 gene=Nk52_evmTU4s1073
MVEAYLVFRFILWSALFGYASWDFYTHRNIKPKGWQLHRAVYACIVLYWARDLFEILFYLTSDNEVAYILVVFWVNTAQSCFLGVLMLIASGWCVTRETLGEHRIPVVVTPSLNLITGLIAQYIIEAEGGHGSHMHKIKISSAFEANLLLLSLCINIFTLMYMLLWIFQNATVEKEALMFKVEQQKKRKKEQGLDEDIGTVAVHEDEGYDSVQLQEFRRESGVGSESEQTGPNNSYRFAGADEENGVRASTQAETNTVHDELVLARIQDESDDTTHLPAAAKLRLVNKFYIAVTIYVLSLLAILIYEIMNKEKSAWYLRWLQDLLLIALVFSLIWIFKLREENPYFVITDYVEELPGGDADDGPQLESFGVEEATFQLDDEDEVNTEREEFRDAEFHVSLGDANGSDDGSDEGRNPRM